jgi:hypothetical protein
VRASSASGDGNHTPRRIGQQASSSAADERVYFRESEV